MMLYQQLQQEIQQQVKAIAVDGELARLYLGKSSGCMVVAFNDLIVCDLITGANIKKDLIYTTISIEII